MERVKRTVVMYCPALICGSGSRLNLLTSLLKIYLSILLLYRRPPDNISLISYKLVSNNIQLKHYTSNMA